MSDSLQDLMSGYVDCPYPDCNGTLAVHQEMYGTDADGRRGILETYVECKWCERDPDDYDPIEWEGEE